MAGTIYNSTYLEAFEVQVWQVEDNLRFSMSRELQLSYAWL